MGGSQNRTKWLSATGIINKTQKKNKIFCIVEIGGELSNNKGINRKGGGLSAIALTEKDKKDLIRIVKNNNGEYIDLYSKKGGIINPLQIRYIAGDDEESDTKETDCPLAKHLSFLEAFFKSAEKDS